MTASLLKSPGFFSVFWTIFVMMKSGWSLLILWFLNCLVPLPVQWGSFQVHQLQLVLYSYWNNEGRHFFKRIKLSHFIPEKGLMLLWCVRQTTEEDKTYYSIDSLLILLTIAHSVIFKTLVMTSFASWQGMLNRRPGVGHRLQRGTVSDCKLALSQGLTDSNPSIWLAGIYTYYFITPTTFVTASAYLK